jgi:hypothetical protein
MAWQLRNTTVPEVFGTKYELPDLAAASAVLDFGTAQSAFKMTGYCKAGAGAVTATLALSDTVGMGTPVTVGVLNGANGNTTTDVFMANPAGKRFGRVTVAGGTMDVRLQTAG